MSQVVNVRMAGEWTDQMYPFTGTDMLNEYVCIFGEENVRLISEEEFQRHALRMQQDRELLECKGADQQATATQQTAQRERRSHAFCPRPQNNLPTQCLLQ